MKLINKIVAITFTSLITSSVIATPHQKLAMISTVSPVVISKNSTSKKKSSKKRVRGGSCLRSIDTVRRKARKLDAIINQSAQRHSVDADLIRAVIAVESCYNIRAVSPAGAQGLMQLIPATADRFGVSNSFDAKQNINAGAKYLRFLLKRYDGDLQKTTAAYNAGEGKVDRYNGIPPYRETRNYVKNVLRIFAGLSDNYNPTSVGFTSSGFTSSRIVVDDGLVNRHPDSYIGMSAEEKAILARIRSLGVKSAYRSRKVIVSRKKKVVKVAPKAQKVTRTHRPIYKNRMRLGEYRKPIKNMGYISPRKKRAIARLKALQKKLRLKSLHTYAVVGKAGRLGWDINRQKAPQLYKRH